MPNGKEYKRVFSTTWSGGVLDVKYHIYTFVVFLFDDNQILVASAHLNSPKVLKVTFENLYHTFAVIVNRHYADRNVHMYIGV